MIVLPIAATSLRIFLAGAVTTNELHYTASYADYDAAAPSFTPGASDGTTNGTTPVTFVQGPAVGAQRQVKRISVYNADTAAATVTIQLNNAGSLRTILSVTLQTGERIEYEDAEGFCVYTVAGAKKVAAVASAPTSTYFEASLTVTQTPVTAATFTTIVFNNEIFDPSNAYNPATGVWTVPETGKYLISAFAHEAGFSDGANVVVSVFVAGAETMRLGEQLPSNPTGNVNAGCQVGSSIVMRLTAGQLVTIRGLIGAAAGGATLRFTGTAGGELTYFRAMRVE